MLEAQYNAGHGRSLSTGPMQGWGTAGTAACSGVESDGSVVVAVATQIVSRCSRRGEPNPKIPQRQLLTHAHCPTQTGGRYGAGWIRRSGRIIAQDRCQIVGRLNGLDLIPIREIAKGQAHSSIVCREWVITWGLYTFRLPPVPDCVGLQPRLNHPYWLRTNLGANEQEAPRGSH